MKKLLVMLLSVAMVLSFTACGSEQATTTASETVTTAATATTAAVTTEAATTAAEVISNWPAQTVNVYVPAKAGGQTDLMARVVCTKLSELTGKNFVVNNDTTGAGVSALETLRTSDPDGTTLVIAAVSPFIKMIIGQYEHGVDEFTLMNTIMLPGEESAVICVRSDSEFQTIQDLIDYAKAHPGELQAGVETNSASHFAHVLANNQFGIEMEYVEAGTNAERTPSFLGGAFDCVLGSATYFKSYVESGDMRALCVIGAQRSPSLPDVPCMVELGYEACEIPLYYFIWGPAGMKEEDVKAINDYVKQVFEDQSVIDQYAAMNQTGAWQSTEDSYNCVMESYKLYEDAWETIQSISQ